MENNNKNRQAILKITKLLSSFYSDKDFIIEILSVLENDDYECLKQYLETDSEKVASEICDKVTSITEGRYIKEFPATRAFRIAYAKENSRQNLMSLLERMSEGNLQIPCDWEMTDEEIEDVKSSEIGDEVYIESPAMPVLLESDEEGEVLIPVFTSQYEISAEYRKKYALAEWSLPVVKGFMNSLEHVTKKKVSIWLDGFSEYNIILTKEMINQTDCGFQ